jgi:UDP-glucuronate 4-epimerase
MAGYAANHGRMRRDFTDISDINRGMMRATGFRSETTIEDGIRDFVAWYRDDHKI